MSEKLRKSRGVNLPPLIPLSSPRSPYEKIDVFSYKATEIRPNLWLGNHKDAHDKTNGWTRIVNVTNNVECVFPDVTYHQIKIDDKCSQPLISNMSDAISFIKEGLDGRDKVLVHCYGGVSRSAAIIIGYLMKMEKRELMDVYNEVKSLRDIVSCNLDFMGQLMMYADTI